MAKKDNENTKYHSIYLPQISYFLIDRCIEVDHEIAKIPDQIETKCWYRKCLSSILIVWYSLYLSEYSVNQNHAHRSYNEGIVRYFLHQILHILIDPFKLPQYFRIEARWPWSVRNKASHWETSPWDWWSPSKLFLSYRCNHLHLWSSSLLPYHKSSLFLHPTDRLCMFKSRNNTVNVQKGSLRFLEKSSIHIFHEEGPILQQYMKLILPILLIYFVFILWTQLKLKLNFPVMITRLESPKHIDVASFFFFILRTNRRDV